MADYISQFTGPQIDARLAKVSQLETGKQDKLVSGTNIKTVGGTSILGSGNLSVSDPNAVKVTAQTWTDAQKTQARTNIGAVAASALSALETAIAAKYSKPSGGIPETDLASGVQSALALARTSIQSLTDYYSKTEVDALLDAVGSEQYVDVATLPTASASTLGKIYLVGPDANGFYDRYYTSYDGSTYSWVPAGNTEINLANYATKEELSQLQQEVTADISQLEAELNGLPAHTENILSVTGNIGSGIVFVANPLLEGEAFTLTLRVAEANWTRFAFSKNNTGTDMGEMKNDGDLEFYKTSNTVGDRVESGTAPSPTTYPYLAYQKPKSTNSIYLDKNIPQGSGLVDDVQDLETRMQDAEDAIAGLSNDIDAVEGDIATIENEIDGIPSDELLNTSAIVADMTYIDNPLTEGDAFTLQYIIGASNWTRFAFAKVNTGTDWSTELQSDNLYFSHQNNEVGSHSWKGNAPDPAVYPYIVYQKASNQNTIKLTKDAVAGLAERIEDIEDGGVVKQAQLSQTSLLNDLSGTISTGYNLYLLFQKPLVPGTEYQFTLDFSDETSANILKLAHIYLLSNKANNTQVGDIVSLYDKTAGGVQSFKVTPSDYVVAVNIIFQSTYSISGATISLKTSYTRPTYGDYDRELSLLQNSMVGKTILMLGDSITQIPQTGASSLDGLMGMGIVEYSAIKLGANVLRGAVGGSHLARRTTTKPSSVTSNGEARAVLDVPSIVESLVSGDWTLQDAAAAYTGMDASLVGIVDTLKNVDMSEVAVVTIFAGTNDMRADAPLGDADSINPYYVNGAVNYISKIFCEAFPQVQLIFYTPCFRKFSTDWEDDSDYADNYENGIDLTLYDYADAILARARDNNLPACDMLRTMGWNKYNYHAFCNDNDATHPRKGFQHLATRICGFLLSMQNRYSFTFGPN